MRDVGVLTAQLGTCSPVSSPLQLNSESDSISSASPVSSQPGHHSVSPGCLCQLFSRLLLSSLSLEVTTQQPGDPVKTKVRWCPCPAENPEVSHGTSPSPKRTYKALPAQSGPRLPPHTLITASVPTRSVRACAGLPVPGASAFLSSLQRVFPDFIQGTDHRSPPPVFSDHRFRSSSHLCFLCLLSHLYPLWRLSPSDKFASCLFPWIVNSHR